MTYCKDCRTEFMVAEDEPCPRCGRYLGGEKVGQREEAAQAAQAVQTLSDAAEDKDAPTSWMLRAMLAIRAPLGWLVAEANKDDKVPLLLLDRGMLLVLLAFPALIGFGLLVLAGERNPYVGVLWLLYLSVFAPPFVCLLTSDDALSALLRFWKLWLLWVVLAAALSVLLWG